MKHLLIIFSILLLSSPLFGDNHKGETLYLWKISSVVQWYRFGNKYTRPQYKGEVENGKPNGLGVLIYPYGGQYGRGTKYVGSWEDGKEWNGTVYYKNGKIVVKYVNGKKIKP